MNIWLVIWPIVLVACAIIGLVNGWKSLAPMYVISTALLIPTGLIYADLRMRSIAMWHLLPSIEFRACPKCGYDLRKLESANACPECGEGAEAHLMRWKWATELGRPGSDSPLPMPSDQERGGPPVIWPPS